MGTRCSPLSLALLLALSVTVGCQSGEVPPAGESPADPDNEALAEIDQAVETQGSWGAYGSGQCVIGARTFYQKKFDVTLSATGVQGSSIGSCKYLGACMYWVSDKVKPSSSQWVRYEWGSVMPQTYDLVIYPPAPGTSGYGHVASIDHMEGNDKGAYQKLYIMDSNFNGDEKKASAIHTFNRKPYGFYRLKKLVQETTCSPKCADNSVVNSKCEKTSCGSSKCVDDSLGPRCVDPSCPAKGDSNQCDGKSVVSCHNGKVTKESKCDAGESCSEDGGAHCVDPACPATGSAHKCDGKGSVVDCQKGQVTKRVQCDDEGEACTEEGGAHCDHAPRGYLDEASCEQVKGWAQDADQASQSIGVQLSFGGPGGDSKATPVSLTASRERSDLCAAIGSCNHGFWMPTPRSLLDGQPHEVRAHGVDVSSGDEVALKSSPKTLQCAPPEAAPSAVLRKVTGAAFEQWHFSPFQDVAPAPAESERVTPALMDYGPDLPLAPQFVRADDGSADVWLLDSGVRRLVPGPDAAVSWHVGATKTMPAPALLQIERGADLTDVPQVQSDGATTWLVDGPFLPSKTPPSAPTGTTSPTPAPTTTGTAPGKSPAGSSTAAEASEQESGGCAQTSGPRGGAWMALGGALLALSLVRRRAGRPDLPSRLSRARSPRSDTRAPRRPPRRSRR